jgi:cytochrome c oxidase subunit 4
VADRAVKSSGIRIYTIVWITLILLTILTVASAGVDLRAFAIMACLCIATFKSILVFLYFMHLRHEEHLVIKLVIPIAIVALAIFIGLTFSDIITR